MFLMRDFRGQPRGRVILTEPIIREPSLPQSISSRHSVPGHSHEG